MLTEPTPYRPLRDDVRDQIRTRIVSGAYEPGERLVERTIAAELGVSRIPVREALQALVMEGFAVDRQTRGIAVRAYSSEQITELAEVAAAIERVLVGSIAAEVDTDALIPLKAVLNETQAAIDCGDTTSAIAANVRFHDVLADLSDASIALEVLAGVRERRRWLLSLHTDPVPVHAEHVEMYDAIAAHDRERAQQLVERHAQTMADAAVDFEAKNADARAD